MGDELAAGYEWSHFPDPAAARARMGKYGSTLDAHNVRTTIERIADYPELVTAVLALLSVREVWGLQRPPSAHVGREYPERQWAERQLTFAPGDILVRRFVTAWEPAETMATDQGTVPSFHNTCPIEVRSIAAAWCPVHGVRVYRDGADWATLPGGE